MCPELVILNLFPQAARVVPLVPHYQLPGHVHHRHLRQRHGVLGHRKVGHAACFIVCSIFLSQEHLNEDIH